MIRRKTCASSKANWQLCTGIYLPSGSCHSAQQPLASSLSFYLCMSTCTLASWKFLRCYTSQIFPPLCTQRQLQWSSETLKSEKQTLVASSQHLLDMLWGLTILDLCSEGTWMDTSLARHCEGCSLRTTGRKPGKFCLHSVPGRRVDTKRQKNMFSCISECQKCLPSYIACVFAVRIIE